MDHLSSNAAANPRDMGCNTQHAQVPIVSFSRLGKNHVCKQEERVLGPESEDDQEVAAIAADWGVSADLFDGVGYELDFLDSDDGLTYGFLVRFDDDTDEDTLIALGLEPGEFSRHVSLNAFDRPEPEDPSEEFEYLARRYIELGGAFTAVVINGEPILQPWFPSSAEAEQFWKEMIAPLSKTEKAHFLRILARLS